MRKIVLGVVAAAAIASPLLAATAANAQVVSSDSNCVPGIVNVTEYKWVPDVVNAGPTQWTRDNAAANTPRPFTVKGKTVAYHRDGTKTQQVPDTQVCSATLPEHFAGEGTGSVVVPFVKGVDTFIMGVQGYDEKVAITTDATITADMVDQFWIGHQAQNGYVIANPDTAQRHIDFSDYKQTVRPTSVNDQGVGYVSQRDLTNLTGEPVFTIGYQMDNQTRWSCSGGGEQSQTSRVIQSRVLVAKPLFNWNSSKVYGYTLDGIDETKGGTYVSGTRLGAPYVGYCPAGEGVTGFLPNVFTNTVLPGVSVNGVALATA